MLTCCCCLCSAAFWSCDERGEIPDCEPERVRLNGFVCVCCAGSFCNLLGVSGSSSADSISFRIEGVAVGVFATSISFIRFIELNTMNYVGFHLKASKTTGSGILQPSPRKRDFSTTAEKNNTHKWVRRFSFQKTFGSKSAAPAGGRRIHKSNSPRKKITNTLLSQQQSKKKDVPSMRAASFSNRRG